MKLFILSLLLLTGCSDPNFTKCKNYMNAKWELEDKSSQELFTKDLATQGYTVEKYINEICQQHATSKGNK